MLLEALLCYKELNLTKGRTEKINNGWGNVWETHLVHRKGATETYLQVKNSLDCFEPGWYSVADLSHETIGTRGGS